MTSVDLPKTWTLGNGEENNRRHPDTFQIPRAELRQAVPVGSAAKLFFIPDDGYVERMWVTVESVTGTGTNTRYTGTLANDPIGDGLSYGDWVEFGPEHIIDICFHDGELPEFLRERTEGSRATMVALARVLPELTDADRRSIETYYLARRSTVLRDDEEFPGWDDASLTDSLIVLAEMIGAECCLRNAVRRLHDEAAPYPEFAAVVDALDGISDEPNIPRPVALLFAHAMLGNLGADAEAVSEGIDPPANDLEDVGDFVVSAIDNAAMREVLRAVAAHGVDEDQ